ncbi:DUF2130 domain-containing protein [Bradyrhizobium hipponense]|uniref:DUF2130 domain-containing protein n=1 Tax=Bradyrhizobium hipponense TaxID=2605638 RepID=A0A5S4YCV9_9BRAD|nr:MULTISPECIES: DUF2130 domain-containing protein [Bradyrhizobium]MDE5446545.1 DUF2130 domain-containing protein [Bradyrhizobium sp. CSA207]TYO61085.1 DUF2130 domain-containing protein [Bradyrhizobium hipponense]
MIDRAGINQLKCPKCGELIPVSETIYHQIEEEARQNVNSEFAQQQSLIGEREQKLKERESDLDKTIQDRIRAAQDRLQSEATAKAHQAVSVEIDDLRRQAAEKQLLLQASQQQELELRKQKRSIEEREKTLELELIRKLDEERAKIEVAITRRLDDQHRLRDAEKDKKLQDAIRVNDELRRKLEQGSQQTQGEVLELQLQQLLSNAFPEDQIEPVPKGVSGADLIQRISSRTGNPCGIILWESKRTKSWSDSWLQKLKDDQRVLKAEMAILVSDALPRDCENFKHVSGIWITNSQCALSLAFALRLQLIEVEMTKLAAVGKNEKMEILYRYLSGSEFRQRVEAIVETFIEMQSELQEERRIAERRWAKREKQIQRVIANTSGMYGDLQGLIGTSLQAIPALMASTGEDERINPVTTSSSATLQIAASQRNDDDIPC